MSAWPVFLGVTVVLCGFAAFATGRALAGTWRPMWWTVPYCLLLGVLADGMGAGLDNDYVKPGDTRVVAHTKMIGAGEDTSVTFDVSKLQSGGPYAFFCSFPGHAALMKGSISVG